MRSLRRARPALQLDPTAFVSTLAMESGGQLSATQSKAVLGALLERGGGDPAAVAKEMGFEALGSDTLGAVLDEVIAAHPDEWARFVEGDDKLMGVFTGAVMKATSGKADGSKVAAELRKPPRLISWSQPVRPDRVAPQMCAVRRPSPWSTAAKGATS